MPVVLVLLLLLLLPALTMPLPTAAHDLPNGATVRFQSHEFELGWHVGTVQIASEDCAMVWKPAPDVSGGKYGLALMFIQKLERQDGTKWIDMPVAPMMKKEPQTCQEGAG